MKKIAVSIIVVGLYGCVTPMSAMSEYMMPNGDWSFKLSTNYSCLDYYNYELNKANPDQSPIDFGALKDVFKKTSELPAHKNPETFDRKICIDKFKSDLSKRAKELCVEKTYELYGCINSEDSTIDSGLQHSAGYGYYMTCYMRCKK